ncbi:MAG: hypothetical protein M3301_00810 [Chloroflexota bacterium]|nr:hypothetical protein [Chloroflexota bacterium]
MRRFAARRGQGTSSVNSDDDARAPSKVTLFRPGFHPVAPAPVEICVTRALSWGAIGPTGFL